MPASREKENWVEEWDELAQVPYMTSGEKWVSFDNMRSIGIKVLIVDYSKLRDVFKINYLFRHVMPSRRS